MNIDIHAHYVPPDSLKVAAEIGWRHGLKLLDRGYRIQDSATRKIPKAPGEYVKLLYFDTITHSRMALAFLVANFGAAHVLLGSDYHYHMGDPEPVASLRATGIDDEHMARIASANPCKLLRIGI